MPHDADQKSMYARVWDYYVDTAWETARKQSGKDLQWPGDEWGDPNAWEEIFQTLFVQHGSVETWQRAVEIGQGSGKYTLKVLQHPDVSVRAYDVSARFLDVCRERCDEHVEANRLGLRLIDVTTPGFLLADLQDWRREVDALYSIDAMVHVDLQYLMAYLVTAAAVLKPGGKLILTLASANTDPGFERLLTHIKFWWEGQTHPAGTGKLEWVSGCMMEQLLPRLGFEIDFLWEPPGIYVFIVASLANPEVGDELARHVTP